MFVEFLAKNQLQHVVESNRSYIKSISSLVHHQSISTPYPTVKQVPNRYIYNSPAKSRGISHSKLPNKTNQKNKAKIVMRSSN